MALSKEADTSSAQPKAILAANGKKPLSIDDLQEALDSLFEQADPEKWDSCVKKVKKSGSADSPYAVCTAQLGKPSKKESGKRLNNRYNMKCRLHESKIGNDSRYKVVLIQEGLGNFKDAFYYTRDALASAASKFEGKKIYADHPSASDEQNRPERSTRDILGHFEKVELVESEDGRAELHAELVIPSDSSFQWAKAMCNHAIEYRRIYGDKDFVGLSINASGDAKEADIDEIIDSAPDVCQDKLLEAKEKGITTVMVVSEISDATSTDLVTEAGAGGKILQLMEESKSMATNKGRMKEDEGGDKEDPEHDDEDKDKALFGKMMKKHLSTQEATMDEGEEASIQQKYEACKEMGMKHSEAFDSAMAAHKVEKHIGKKKEAADKEEAAKKEAAEKVPMDPKKESGKEEDSEKKEAAKDVVQLAGRVAFLETELKKERLTKFIDSKLAESKLPRSVTKLFMAKTKGFKDDKDFTEKFELFSEAYNAERDNDLYVPSFEKAVNEPSESGDYSDCVTE